MAQLPFRGSIRAAWVLMEIPIDSIFAEPVTLPSCVTPDGDEDARVGEESRCNYCLLFLGRPIRQRPVEEAVTSELF